MITSSLSDISTSGSGTDDAYMENTDNLFFDFVICFFYLQQVFCFSRKLPFVHRLFLVLVAGNATMVEYYSRMKSLETVLKYGTTGLHLEYPVTPGFYGIILGRQQAALDNAVPKIAESLAKPINSKALSDIAKGRKSVCIVISDVTRPTPSWMMLPPILDVLKNTGIERRSVKILIATGMHRPSTPQEQTYLVGPSIAGAYAVIDHAASDPNNLVDIGTITGNVPAYINRIYAEAELKILTGFIEPYMWAGFSGGRKSILPGISGLETLRYMHGPAMISHPSCEYGMLEGNPFHEAGLEILNKAGADFIVNVTLNEKREITGIFSGDPVAAHLEGCAFLSKFCCVDIDDALDFIVTTNAGAPLDCNLYQTVKGITGASAVVRDKGDIVIASQCTDGVGSAEYRQILEMADSPESFLRRLTAGDFFIPDQWCAQEMYQVINRKNVWIHADGLTGDEIRKFHLHPIQSIEKCITDLLKKHGSAARWAIVPEGPMVILGLKKRYTHEQ
jgi:lactate racemase